MNGKFENFVKNVESIFITEGYKEKLNKIKSVIPSFSGVGESLLQKREDSFDLNKIVNSKNPLNEFNTQSKLIYNEIIENASRNLLLQKLFTDIRTYTESNDYPESFTALLFNDFYRKFKNTKRALPEFDSVFVSGVYSSVKDSDSNNIPNLVKVYSQKQKEFYASSMGGGGDVKNKNKWVFIPGANKGSKKFVEKSKLQMALSSNKTKWCLRAQDGCNHYPNDDFHFYLDNDGDAIISLRVSGGTLVEVSGSNNDQTLTDKEKRIASDYIFNSGKFSDFNVESVKISLGDYSTPPKPDNLKSETLTKWARDVFQKYKNGSGKTTISFDGDANANFQEDPSLFNDVLTYLSFIFDGRVRTKGRTIELSY